MENFQEWAVEPEKMVLELPPLTGYQRAAARKTPKLEQLVIDPPTAELVALPAAAVEDAAEIETDAIGDGILNQYATVVLVVVGTLAFVWVAYEVIEAVIPLFRQWAISLMEVVLDAAKAVAIAAVYLVGAIGLAYLVVLWLKSLFSASPKADFPHIVRHDTLPGNSTTPKTRKFVQTFEEIIEE